MPKINSIPLFLIKFYRYTLSYFLGGHCRFYPSCSEYAMQAYSQYGFLKSTRLVLIRLSKCHPFSGKKGFDPVPEDNNYQSQTGCCAHTHTYNEGHKI